jgi:hypothetical protein
MSLRLDLAPNIPSLPLSDLHQVDGKFSVLTRLPKFESEQQKEKDGHKTA